MGSLQFGALPLLAAPTAISLPLSYLNVAHCHNGSLSFISVSFQHHVSFSVVVATWPFGMLGAVLVLHPVEWRCKDVRDIMEYFGLLFMHL